MDKELFGKWLSLAVEHEKATGKTPVVVGIELYEHFDNPCKIIAVHDDARQRCVVETRFGSRTTIDAEELTLRPRH